MAKERHTKHDMSGWGSYWYKGKAVTAQVCTFSGCQQALARIPGVGGKVTVKKKDLKRR